MQSKAKNNEKNHSPLAVHSSPESKTLTRICTARLSSPTTAPSTKGRGDNNSVKNLFTYFPIRLFTPIATVFSPFTSHFSRQSPPLEGGEAALLERERKLEMQGRGGHSPLLYFGTGLGKRRSYKNKISRNRIRFLCLERQMSFLPSPRSRGESVTNRSPLTVHFSPLIKPAFTMAEVLITLGIIGIVAAMTLPSLIATHKKKVLQNQFKVAYSMLQQAYLKIQADWGYTPNCYYWDKNPYGGAKCIKWDDRGGCTGWELPDGSPLPNDYNGNMNECANFYESLEKTIQVINKCEKKAYEKGCIPEYEGVDTVITANNPDKTEDDAHKATDDCPAFRKANLLNNSTAYVFKNGVIMIPYSTKKYPIFLIDINGKKSPNKWGHDLFVFKIRGNTNKQLELYADVSQGCGGLAEKGGLTTKQMIENMYNNKYTK